MNKQEIRVRFAPSPTGFLHLGGARTALFNWLWARHNGGKFILRIEDTDLDRSTDASVDQILESLSWLGLDWDEGPFFQSQRLDIYRDHLRRLHEAGKIYPAFETREELDRMREEAVRENRPVYDRRSLLLTREEAEHRMAAGDTFVWRFRTPTDGVTRVPETLLGSEAECVFENSTIGDFIITRPGTITKPGMPLYNFVCTVDDAVMKITHVIRGADHLSNTAKQVLLYEAMGYPVPTFTHLPLIMKNNKKMSKRDEEADPRYPVSISARRDLGYLRESVINFLAMLGWSFPNDREFFHVQELVETFDLDRLVKSNANFDEGKFLHTNGLWMRGLPRETLVARASDFLDRAGLVAPGRDDAWRARIIGLVLERCSLLSEIPAATEYFFHAPMAYDADGEKKFFNGASDKMTEITAIIAETEPFTHDRIEESLRTLAARTGEGLGKIAQPIRLAITGRTASPGLFETMEVLGRDEVVARLNRAVNHIHGIVAP